MNVNDQPKVVILVQGHDVFGLLGLIGFAPSELFCLTRPLVPTDPAQRIAVYRCNCGQGGCGCIAPLIKRVGAPRCVPMTERARVPSLPCFPTRQRTIRHGLDDLVMGDTSSEGPHTLGSSELARPRSSSAFIGSRV